jgi:hypothetical protein
MGALGALAACTFTRDLDYLTRGADDGGVHVDVGIEPGDAGVDGPVCPPEGRIRPLRSFDYVPPLPDGEAPQALTCDRENILDEDGKLAMLDRTENGTVGRGRLKGYEIAGCVGVEFEPNVPVTNVGLRLGPVPDGCRASPCDPDGGCSSTPGLQAYLFAGTTRDELEFVANPKLAGILESQRFDIPPPLKDLHVVVVCRHGNVSVARDDVGVDAVWTECR